MIVDTSALFAFLRAEDPDRHAVTEAIEEADLLVVSPFVVAELDYLVSTRMGQAKQMAMLAELTSGAYELPALLAADLIACTAVIEQYRDHDIGVTDASLVVLAERYATHQVCTLDRRHFSVLRGLDGRPFDVLP